MTNRIADLRTAQGWSQAQLADLLALSRQTVIALEQGKTDPALSIALRVSWIFRQPLEAVFFTDLDEQMLALNQTWEHQKRRANAFSELGILERMGDEGWELTGFGAGYLLFRRPEDPTLRRTWQYHRQEGLLSTAERASLEKAGWSFCGSWIAVFHYFKRELRPGRQAAA